MNDLKSFRIKRWLQRCGFVVRRSESVRYTYDRENFPRVSGNQPTIFDVGANIGQSSIWFKHSFPSARVFAYEPVQSVYQRLKQSVDSIEGVEPLHQALGAEAGEVRIPRVASSRTQITQVLKPTQDDGGDDYETIHVTTVDQAVNDLGVDSIDILKTDTEGFDVQVVEGAERLLRERRIGYLISEVSIQPGDEHHTNFFELRDSLAPFGYAVTSFFDLTHRPGKQLHYFNAMFEPV